MKKVTGFSRRSTRLLLAGAGLTAVAGLHAGTAAAQVASTQQTPDEQAAQQPAEDATQAGTAAGGDIVITGSRIARDGFRSPTPLTVLGEEQIRTQAPTNNIADFVNQIPAVTGSLRPANTRQYLSNGLAGINAINLRNLGTERTLVLLDGRRSVGSSITGAVDVNDFPQALIKSVEIVTGGASAAYGSDAVSGVVNFVLDKEFTGFKATAENGITGDGDGHNYLFSAAAGTKFADGRGHIVISGEYAHRDGIFQVDRDWNQNGDRVFTNPAYNATNGQPQYLVVTNAGMNNTLPGSIINASAGAVPNALRGIYFGQGGSVNRYNYGTASNSTMTVGGDWALADGNRRIGLDPSDDRRGGYARASFDVTSDITVFAEGSYYWNRSNGNAGPTVTAAYTLSASNPYLINALGAANLAGVTSVTLGTSSADLPYRETFNTRSVQRYAGGAEGRFDLLGSQFRWDFYGQYGRTNINEQLRNIVNSSRLALATDAVAAPAGNALGVAASTIVCRSTLTNTTNGCVPLNRLGIGVADPAAVSYVQGTPTRDQRFEQTVAGLNLSFDPFSTWAGPVSIATGAEYRKEKVSGSVETQYQTGWQVGNFLPTFGSYSVKEAYLETVVPLGAGLEFNGAIRGTDYSTSGYVTTWKAGLTFEPIPDVRFRATRSRDIRAPNLNELFQSGTSRTNTLNDPFNGNATVTFSERTTGNQNLSPEIADNLTLGVVVQPRFVPGLSVSVDYTDIRVKDAIGQVYAQTIVNRCFEGKSEYCVAITRTPGGVTDLSVNVSPFNFARLRAKALDINATYRLPLDTVSASIPGELTLRGLATHYLENYVDNGVDVPTSSDGANGIGSTFGAPSWVYRVSATYAVNNFTLTATGRGVSSGTIDNSYIVCSTSCPASTVANPTINSNHVPGAVFADLNITQRIEVGASQADLFLNIANLFNRDPEILPYAGLSTNPTYYDYLGRLFRVGVRFEMK